MTRTAIDSNVIVALWSQEPAATRMVESLRAARAVGPLVVAAPVWAELHAAPGATPEFVARFLTDTAIAVDTEPRRADLARRRPCLRGLRRSAAHVGRRPAEATPRRLRRRRARRRACGCLLTLDPERYRTAFAGLRIDPRPCVPSGAIARSTPLVDRDRRTGIVWACRSSNGTGSCSRRLRSLRPSRCSTWRPDGRDWMGTSGSCATTFGDTSPGRSAARHPNAAPNPSSTIWTASMISSIPISRAITCRPRSRRTR